MTESLVLQALSRLRDDDHPALRSLAILLVEDALDRPLRDIIEPERVVTMTVASIDVERIGRSLGNVIRPILDRQREILDGRGDRAREWLPGDAEAQLEAIVARTRVTPRKWMGSLVDPNDVRELLAPVLQETLLAFARRASLFGKEGGGAGAEAPPKASSGLLGGLAKGIAQSATERASKLGKGVLGNLGAEMEKRMGSAARDFSQGAFEPLRDAFRDRVKSPEGKAILLRMRSRAIRKICDAKASELLELLDAAPREKVDALIAAAITHDIAREEVRAMVRDEVEVFLAAREGMTLRGLLDEWNMTDAVRDEAHFFAMKFARSAVRSDAFEGWLRALLTE